MKYRIEVYDTWGRRIASYQETPLLEVTRRAPDQPDEVRGILPGHVTGLSHAYRVRVFVEDMLFCEARVLRTAPQWSDTRKLVLDRYVNFHEVIAFEAEQPAGDGDGAVTHNYRNRELSAIVNDAINQAAGPIHYLVAHEAYPDGAQREYAKFLARKTAENELELGGIASGQWVGADRINSANAYAKDGDTIAGLEIDGEGWPDLRLMMIDCEETGRNAHAVKRHPETAGWSDERYDTSGYKLDADAAQAALQNLIDEKGIDYIELNPHRDASGQFDDRVDAYGRYVGLVYGGGECFNAAMVELGCADVYLYEDGAYHVPEMALKEFFSYAGVHADSVESTGVVISSFEAVSNVFDILTTLAYAAGGFVWSMDTEYAVRFRKADHPDRVVFSQPVENGVTLGSDSTEITNIVYFEGHPFLNPISKTYSRGASADEYAPRARRLRHVSITLEEDADKFVYGLLDDAAYPEPTGSVVFFHGQPDIRVGDLVELRGGALRRIDREIEGEWSNWFQGKLVGRAAAVTHRFMGRRVQTTVMFTSPLRSVRNPVSYIMRAQPTDRALLQFRLDDAAVGLDMGYRLD